jgi:hypothetical protein
MRERLAQREPVRVSEPSAAVLRREREGSEAGMPPPSAAD